MRGAWLVLMFGCVAAEAQFGALDKIKQKVDSTQDKAKPVTDRAEKAVQATKEWTPQQEEQIGAASAAKLVAMFGLSNSAKLNMYVNLVGSTVARNASRQVPYRFGVLNTGMVNAFALPGGYIFVTRGALASMENEAQLAGVLGHEIVHVASRHLESEVRGKRLAEWGAEEAKAQANKSVYTPDIVKERASALVQDLFNSKLSRDKEEKADVEGTELAAMSGYQAGGLRDFLQGLEKVQSGKNGKMATGQLLSTHPPFKQRVSALKSVVGRLGDGGQTLSPRFEAALP